MKTVKIAKILAAAAAAAVFRSGASVVSLDGAWQAEIAPDFP